MILNTNIVAKPRTKDEVYSLIEEQLSQLKEECNDKKSSKRYFDAAIYCFFIVILGWIVVPISIVGNQIIEVCLVLMAAWFLYNFFFFSIPRSISVFRSSKKYLDTYIGMSQDERDEIHNAVDRATPSLSKTGTTSSIMFVFIALLFVIMVVSPFIIKEIDFNVVISRPLMSLFLFIVIGFNIIILIGFNRSLKGMHKYEKIVEKHSFSDEKTMKIIDRFNLKKIGPWWFIIWGNVPKVLSIIFLLFIIIENFNLFDLPLNVLGGLIIIQIVMIYLLRKRYILLSHITLSYQIQNNLINLRERMKKGKIRKIQKILDEFDMIMYKELTLLKEKSQ